MLTIVLLPGMDGSGRLFEPFIAALAGAFHIVTVRYPPTARLGYEELQQIAQRALPDEGEFILLGESFSGPIAVSLAATQPKGLVGLILCSTFVRNPRPLFGPVSALTSLLPAKLAPLAVLSFLLMGRDASPQLTATLSAAMSEVSNAALQTRLQAVLRVDVAAQMKTLRLPVLYLQAKQDRLVPPTAFAQIAQLQPSTRLEAIDAPHFLLQVAPTAAADVVRTFARTVQRA
jgi:pimeloyl-ACP methyl ester carboxylesterase